jgi:uncharacterized protein involved in exopolysaccharide biosynthesis
MFEAPRQIRSAVVGRGDAAPTVGSFPEIDFRRIGSTAWRGRTTVLVTTAIALVLAFLFILLMPHKFTATTQILIDPTDLHAVGTEASPVNSSNDTALLYVESQVSVLSSDSVLRRVVASQNLADDPEFARDVSPARLLLNQLLAAFGLLRGPVIPDKSLAALNELKRHLRVTRTERTYVIDISVVSEQPEKAARIANAVAAAYLAEQTKVRADAARQVSQSLTARLNELKDRVREAEERVEAYKANNNIVGANGQLVDEQQLSDLNNQLSAAHARSTEAKAHLDQIESVQKSKDVLGAFPEALQSPTITALRTQYAEIMRREAEQTASLGARHPAVIEIQAQADRLRHMIGDEVDRTVLAARGAYEGAKADENALAGNLEALKHTAITTDKAMVGMRELERDVQASRAVYEAFLVRARETGEQEQVDTKNIHVISNAEPPLRRSSPPSTLLVVLAALVAGVGAGIGIVLMRSPVEAAVTRGTVKAAVPAGVPILAVLPSVDIAFGLDTVDDPKSRFARGIHQLYEALQPDGGQLPTVLVVAADEEDDSTAVALTLAAVAAATQRVLLIDADVERRTLAAIDADQGAAGLVDVAVGRRSLGDAVIHDRQTNINLMAFISQRSRRDRRISDNDVRLAFDQTKRFDMVIVTAFDLRRDPTARFFAGLVDQIVLVVRAEEQHDGAVERLVARLGFDAGKVRGTVLTGVGSE